MHVLVAPNAFKHGLSAIQAAESIAEGLRASAFAGRTTIHPVGDGGDGTGELLRRHLGGTMIPVSVHDPLDGGSTRSSRCSTTVARPSSNWPMPRVCAGAGR